MDPRGTFVTLAGLGCGTADTVTAEVSAALREADCVIGAARLLERSPEGPRRVAAVRPREILEIVEGCTRPCVVYSGDTGFFSGARTLLPLLEERGISFRVLPGVSSVQYLAAALGRPWQDWVLCSAHGTRCDAVAAVCQGRPACFLTGGELGPRDLCRQLTEAGLGDLAVTVGEDLSYPDQKLSRGTAREMAERAFAPLSVLLAEAAPAPRRRAPGIPDGEFLRGKTPMTKQEVRAVIFSKLAVGPGDVCWDVGAGTGSVSVEMALQAGSVWAVERDPAACGLVRANREKFCAWGLHLVEGAAPEALSSLPAPDAVFVGGSGGSLREILERVRDANAQARICVSAITLETLHTALESLDGLGYETETVQIAVSRTKKAGKLHLLMAQDPIFLVTGTRP